jgi:hypothetical protein
MAVKSHNGIVPQWGTAERDPAITIAERDLAIFRYADVLVSIAVLDLCFCFLMWVCRVLVTAATFAEVDSGILVLAGLYRGIF